MGSLIDLGESRSLKAGTLYFIMMATVIFLIPVLSNNFPIPPLTEYFLPLLQTHGLCDCLSELGTQK